MKRFMANNWKDMLTGASICLIGVALGIALMMVDDDRTCRDQHLNAEQARMMEIGYEVKRQYDLRNELAADLRKEFEGDANITVNDDASVSFNN